MLKFKSTVLAVGLATLECDHGLTASPNASLGTQAEVYRDALEPTLLIGS